MVGGISEMVPELFTQAFLRTGSVLLCLSQSIKKRRALIRVQGLRGDIVANKVGVRKYAYSDGFTSETSPSVLGDSAFRATN